MKAWILSVAVALTLVGGLVAAFLINHDFLLWLAAGCMLGILTFIIAAFMHDVVFDRVCKVGKENKK